MVDRLLSMLNQYLISNRHLSLDKTFKVYLKILSAQHSKINRIRKPPKKKKRTFGKLHVGSRTEAFKAYWAIDCPNNIKDFENVFDNKCLPLCLVLANSQHNYYQNLDKDFLYMAQINSKLYKKQKHAAQLILDHLENLYRTTNLSKEGPYELSKTMEILSETYKCQFFVFEGTLETKLIIRYPAEYNSDLKPIFLYKLFDSNHVIFIKNIHSFYKQKLKICLSCKKSFKTQNYRHFCKSTKSCFACHRFFRTTSTFYHSKLDYLFCDRYTTSESSRLCNICNVTLYSKSCAKQHKHLCNSKGFFGFKCLKCSRFTYRQGNLNSLEMKKKHICDKTISCKYCHEFQEENHICKLRCEKIPNYHSKLIFLNIEFFQDKNTPCVALIYAEEMTRNSFTEKLIWNPDLNIADSEQRGILYFDYLSKIEPQFKEFKKFKMLNKEVSVSLEKSSNFEKKLLKLLLSNDFAHSTVLVPDTENLLLLYLLKLFCNVGVCPNIVKNGSNILLLEIKSLSVRIINSTNYVPGNEYELAKQFDIPFNPPNFPTKFMLFENFEYCSSTPDAIFFPDSKLPEELLGKSKWDFRKEFVNYCSQKMLLFSFSMLKLLSEFFDFQTRFSIKSNLLNLYNSPNITLGGAVFRLYKAIFLSQFDMRTVFNEYGKPGKFSSRLENQYVSFLEYLNPDSSYITAFNNPKGQFYFKEAIPDAYCKDNGECVFVLGCYFHCHLDPNCPVAQKLTNKTRHGKSFKEVNDERELKMVHLMQNHLEINRIDEIWECQIKAKILNDPNYKYFLDNIYIKIPLERLIPRNCYRGAYCDNFRLKWSYHENNNENLFFLDVNGLYSEVSVSKPFFVGKYIILIGKELQKLTITNKKFYYDDKIVTGGSILLEILPPKDLFFPFLMYRTKMGKNCNTLCKKCCEIGNTKHCRHNDKDRALIGTYLISEIEYALTLNYTILNIFESHVYLESDFIFKDFVNTLNYYKTIHSDCFKNLKSIENKQACIDKLNSKTNQNFLIDSIQPNAAKRLFYKLAQNSFFGKFGQHDNKSKTIFCTDQAQIDSLINSNVELNDVVSLNDYVCFVETKPNELKLAPNLKNNVYYSAQITAYAREVMHCHLMNLSNCKNVKIFQVNCDSIIFSLSKDQPCPLDISFAMGDFKHVLDGKILNYYSLGAKNYSLTYLLENGQIKTIHKISGLKLESEQSKEILNSDCYNNLLKQLQHNIYTEVKIENKKKKLDLASLTFQECTQAFTISNKVSVNRIIQKNTPDFQTLPYGYTIE